MDKLNFVDECRVRKVSRSFRDLIDERGVKRANVNFRSFSWFSRIEIDDTTFHYGGLKSGCEVYEKTPYRPKKKLVRGENHVKLALSDLMIVLKNPKQRIESMTIMMNTVNEENVKHLDQFLKSLGFLGFKLSVSEMDLRLDEHTHFLPIICCVKPGVLDRLDLDLNMKSEEAVYKKLVESDQWKQLGYLSSTVSTSFKFEHLVHLPNFRAHLDGQFIREDVKLALNTLLSAENFEEWNITSDDLDAFPTFVDLLGQPKLADDRRGWIKYDFEVEVPSGGKLVFEYHKTKESRLNIHKVKNGKFHFQGYFIKLPQ